MSEQTAALPKPPSLLSRFLSAVALLRESLVGMIGAAIILFWVLVAVFAPLLAPFDPNATISPMVYPLQTDAQGNFFLLGTDHLGRDILSRIIYGSQRVLLLAPLATLCAYIVGIPMGLAAGYLRGKWDTVLSFVTNVILSFPVLVLYVIIIATVGASAANILVAITFASAPGIMRIVRGLVLDLRNREYVAAAQTRGESSLYIMFMEILPNARGPIIVDACLRLGYVIITIGVLGFLGLGLPPPDPDWGGMINETRQLAMTFPHMAVYPCIAISSLVLGFNLMADGLREISLRD
jgi:peptide/nickel transport system permease protein